MVCQGLATGFDRTQPGQQMVSSRACVYLLMTVLGSFCRYVSHRGIVLMDVRGHECIIDVWTNLDWLDSLSLSGSERERGESGILLTQRAQLTLSYIEYVVRFPSFPFRRAIEEHSPQ